MSSAKTPRSVISQLSDLKSGEKATFFALLAEKTKNSTRDGKAYFICRFRDARRTATMMVWADSDFIKDCEEEWIAGGFYKIHGAYFEHEKYGPQIEIDKIRPVEKRDEQEGFDIGEYVKKSRFDSEEMFRELIELVRRHVATPALADLTVGLLETHSQAIKKLPATQRTYYPFQGGWLEHTLSVTRKALRLAHDYHENYPDSKPPINVELVVAGAALHELGRIGELALPELPTDPVNQTTDGRFYGHLILGRDMLREAARNHPDLDPMLLKLLEHMLLTYLTLPEWGSPRLPLIPEVLILHHADDLDAKMEMYVRCLSGDAATGEFTDRDPVLGKQLFKGRTV
ncbi:HD domain-containing protein [Zavarzinella formosa]|uniref:HD domain-containing protein n=1 Tax=Zavarzinella formosa TaxID=360055 RepID=UPI00030DD28C|nr:HD domain-containing protein [Zavarzinella formosa]